MVCDRTSKNLLAPGNEDRYYAQNPGEGWAETYAQLKYPDVAWQYNPLMKPDQGAFDAARKDVLTPWTKPTSEVFTSSFGKRGTNVHRFKFDLRLDGALSMKLRGPSKSNYNLVISSNGRFEGRTITHGSRDSVSYQAACREDQLEHVSVAVKRMSGSGPFTLSVKYDG
jgi:hypothetical protein